LGRFLEDVALVADIDNYQEGAETVSLMTLHSAKGLEFNVVFIVGLEEYIFPSSRSVQEGSPNALEEERRLCYVGFTRARQQLYISHATRRMRYDGGFSNNPPSRFLKEMPKDNVEHVNIFGKTKTQLGRDLPPRETVPAKPKTKLDVGRRFDPQMASVINRPTQESIDSGPPDYEVGDKVLQPLHGVGEVVALEPRKGDYEVTVLFDQTGKTRKFIARYANLTIHYE